MGDTGIEITWRWQVMYRTGWRAYGNHETKRYGQAGIGEQANSGGLREVRLEVLADHSTEVQCAVLALNEKVAND